MELLQVAYVCRVSDNNEAVLSTSGHFFKAEREVDATCADRVRNVLIVGLDGRFSPVNALI